MMRVMELRPPSYFALAALIDGPLHGYGIMRRAHELSEGRIRVSTGTLYSLLQRAMAESLVTAGDPYVQGGRQRRDYTLTPAGRLALQEESERMTQAARAVGARLRASAGPVLA
jgi:PadR family transcriptional regulator, regulatory protein PadR